MASPTALNLEAIQKAIDQHNERCKLPILQIVMSPFEVERLGFDNFNGIPIVGDENMPTGRFRLVCDGVDTGDLYGVKEEKVEAPSVEERELVPAGPTEIQRELLALIQCQGSIEEVRRFVGLPPRQGRYYLLP
jgi:hypothetical protein